METFEQWWDRVGIKLMDTHTNYPEIARAAFEAAKAQSRNYVADEETHPEKITFANGRVVRLSGWYLTVDQVTG